MIFIHLGVVYTDENDVCGVTLTISPRIMSNKNCDKFRYVLLHSLNWGCAEISFHFDKTSITSSKFKVPDLSTSQKSKSCSTMCFRLTTRASRRALT